MTSEAQLRAQKKYDAQNTKQYHLKLNAKTDADIISRLEHMGSTQTYIKRLIREDIARNKPYANSMPEAFGIDDR